MYLHPTYTSVVLLLTVNSVSFCTYIHLYVQLIEERATHIEQTATSALRQQLGDFPNELYINTVLQRPSLYVPIYYYCCLLLICYRTRRVIVLIVVKIRNY